MKFKALRHRHFIHTFGHFLKDWEDEIFYSEIPKLMPPTMTMRELREQFEEYPNALKKLDDYLLVDITLKIEL